MKAEEGAEKWYSCVTRLDGMDVGLHLRISEPEGEMWWLKRRMLEKDILEMSGVTSGCA